MRVVLHFEALRVRKATVVYVVWIEAVALESNAWKYIYVRTDAVANVIV